MNCLVTDRGWVTCIWLPVYSSELGSAEVAAQYARGLPMLLKDCLRPLSILGRTFLKQGSLPFFRIIVLSAMIRPRMTVG